MAVKSYYPEMNQPRPYNCPIHCPHHGRGGHYFLVTDLELRGQGIEQVSYERRAYSVTRAAFNRLAEQYDISCELLLD